MPYFEVVKNKYKNKPLIESVPSYDAHSKIDYKEFYLSGYPFILKNYFKSYEPEFYINTLRNKYGDSVIQARINKSDSINEYKENRTYKEMNLKEYLDHRTDSDIPNSSVYLSNISIKNFDINDFGLKYPTRHSESIDYFDPPKLWIGNAGTYTPLHRDSSDNFIYQISGSKKWTIFNIQDEGYLYFQQNEYGKAAHPLSEFATSRVDIRNPDLELFPLFKNAKPISFLLTAGDLLYLPMGYGHHVENIHFSIMVNLWQKLETNQPAILRD